MLCLLHNTTLFNYLHALLLLLLPLLVTAALVLLLTPTAPQLANLVKC
jgi:hypothetical protein